MISWQCKNCCLPLCLTANEGWMAPLGCRRNGAVSYECGSHHVGYWFETKKIGDESDGVKCNEMDAW